LRILARQRAQFTAASVNRLLWGHTGRRDKEQWFDDRVSGAELTYFTETPALPDNVEERVKVKFREYTQAGRTLVVWLLSLERYQEAKNG